MDENDKCKPMNIEENSLAEELKQPSKNVFNEILPLNYSEFDFVERDTF